MPDTLSDLRTELATATRILAQHQLIGMFGHVSVLTDDPQRYLVCPGAGARKDRCRSTDVLELDLDHEFAPGLPLELYMHSEASVHFCSAKSRECLCLYAVTKHAS